MAGASQTDEGIAEGQRSFPRGRYRVFVDEERVGGCPHEDEVQTDDDPRHLRNLVSVVDEKHPTKLVIDMRDNGGGDNTIGEAQIVKPIAVCPDLNSKGHLYILIGPRTFSAAMNNAAQFQDGTTAITVGETIGEKPKLYQEPRQFRLPNSHLVVRASTLFYTFRKTGGNAVRPSKEIIPSWDDVKSGRDPVLEWVLSQP